ncbi:MAG: hypothetical protein ACYTG0_36960, partial [Planctomycetota bacterium]
MTLRNVARYSWLPALALLVTSAAAQDYRGRSPLPSRGAGYRVASRPEGQAASQAAPQRASVPLRVAARTPEMLTRQPDEHPLMPAIRWARDGLERIRQIEDYSAIMVKRERI